MAESLATGGAGCRIALLLVRVGVGLVLGLGAVIRSPAQTTPPRDLTQFTLEDLMNVQVISVSKKEQKLAKTGAAIFVITQEDIRRSGATNIPDVLRIAPGVDVAQIDSNHWAISVRGFNSVFANKVLVLIDGRTVYLDSGSNVFWDQVDVPLENIDHIEVIRGPGGTVWGANAVNGVISIITKNAKATQGGLITAGAGSKESAEGLVQYGGKIGSTGEYRVFGRYFNVNNALTPGGQSAADEWHAEHGGFRSDWNLSTRDTLTVQGDFFRSDAGGRVRTVFSNALPLQDTLNVSIANTTGNIQGRWNHTLKSGSDTSLQVYYDYDHRPDQGQVDETHHKVDLDFSHHVAAGSRNDVVWGLSYRFEADDIRAGYAVQFLPPRSRRNLFSTFVQDEIKLTHSISLTLGSKFEHNAFTGFEYEPSAQLVWTPSNRHTLWASAARAIRQPSLVDEGLQKELAVRPLSGGAFAVPTLFGNPQLKAEQLRDYEVGYRSQLTQRLSLDVTAFESFYRGIRTAEPEAPVFTLNPGPPHLVFPLRFENLAAAQNYGTELFATWDVTGRWRVSTGYSWLRMSIVRDPSSHDSTIEQTTGESPEHQYQVRSWLKLHKNLDWDSTLIYVSALPHLAIPGYFRLDSRLGWRLGEFVEIGIVGQNLLSPRHLEFLDTHAFILNSEVERSVLGKITWRF
jgi:iron complex outermembrane receptor protein